MDDQDDDDAAVVAAFLAEAGPAEAVSDEAPTGLISQPISDNSRKSPTSVSLASSSGLDDDDLLSGLL